MEILYNGFQTPGAQGSISLCQSTSWSHCPWIFQFRFPGKSADMVSSFHSLQSLSYPFRHPGSSVHVVTSVQQCQLPESLPTRWWWCEGGPWGRARRSEKRVSSKHQELSAHVLNQPAKSLGASLKFCFPVSFYLKLIFGSLSFLFQKVSNWTLETTGGHEGKNNFHNNAKILFAPFRLTFS